MDLSMILTLSIWTTYLVLAHSRNDYLFFFTPGSLSPFRHPGVYGGPIKYQSGGNASELFRHGLACVQYEDSNHIQRGLRVKAITFDTQTGDLLLHVGEASNSKNITILRAPTCGINHGCPNKYVEVVLQEVSMTHTVAAFAAYAGQVYLVTERVLKIAPQKRQKLIEIRWLSGCKPSQTFSIDRCTTMIAVVKLETYKTKSKFLTTSGLAIVPSRSSKGVTTFTFFIQLQETMSNEQLADVASQAFVLYRVTEQGESSLVHMEFVHAALNTYVIQGVGQISYREGFLCWTALDKIACGEVDERGRLSNIRVMLKQNEVKYVCQAPPGDELIASITTGVAIAKVPRDIDKDETVFYFGCVSSVRGIGGSGMVRKTGRIPAQIFPLRHAGSRVLAGSMFMTTPDKGCLPGKYVKQANLLSGVSGLRPYICMDMVIFLVLCYLTCNSDLFIFS